MGLTWNSHTAITFEGEIRGETFKKYPQRFDGHHFLSPTVICNTFFE